MIGHLYTLLFLGAEAPAPSPAPDSGGGGSSRRRVDRARAVFTLDRGRKVFYFDTDEARRNAQQAAEAALLAAMSPSAPKPSKAKRAATAEPVLARFASQVVDVPSLRQFAVDTGREEEFARAAQSRHYQELLQLFQVMRQAAEEAEEEDTEMLLLAEYA
jgi:hypothetical protein